MTSAKKAAFLFLFPLAGWTRRPRIAANTESLGVLRGIQRGTRRPSGRTNTSGPAEADISGSVSRTGQREVIYVFIRLEKKENKIAHGTDGPLWNFLNPLVSHQRPTLEKYFASNCAAEVFLSSAL